jgi:hypothetical protein
MIVKFISAAVFALLLIGLGINILLKKHQENQSSAQWAERNSVAEIARRSKAEGKKSIKLQGPIVNYGGRNMDFGTALKTYSLVIAEPIENRSYVVNTDDIHTWYKFRLVETISARPSGSCITCAPVPEIPAEAQPLRTDEFVVIASGGTVNIDGVDVTLENNALPPFISGQKYLLFVSFMPSRVTKVAGGPAAAFRIKDRDDLEAVDRWDRPIPAEINKRFARKLSALKSHLIN